MAGKRKGGKKNEIIDPTKIGFQASHVSANPEAESALTPAGYP
jgi:hypothetical protein